MASPTVFLSAATIDLKEWRDVLHGAFSRAGFRVLTQDQSLGSAPGNVKRLLTATIDESDCIIHLAGMGYGADAADPFPAMPGFGCSWTQFEYYHAHEKGKDVIAFVCAPKLSRTGFTEKGDAADIARKQRLQQAHRERVTSGEFDGTPLAGKVGRTSNEHVDSVQSLLKAVAAAVGTLHKLGDSGKAVSAELDVMRTLHQLPPRPSGFVGREADLAKLRALNPAAGAVLTGVASLRGMGGIGKTALALVLAHEWSARFPDAQFFLDARGTQPDPPSARKLMEQVVLAFHPTAKLPDDAAAIAGIYRDVLGGKKVLILLDNALGAAQAKPLIPPAGCALIVTSRHSFMLGTVKPHDVGRLPEAEANALLREFAPDLTEAEAATLVPLCAGLPLALRLAGSHIALDAAERNGPPDFCGYILALGEGPLATLDAEAADAGEVTISETLRLSEAQLPEAEREAWRKLGVFTASFDARAAQAIAGADATMLGHFVRRSLLEREGAERFKLHDLAGEYACGQLGDKALASLHLAHARHYTEVGEEADDLYFRGDALSGLALFDRERAQIEAAHASLAGRGDKASARRMLALVNGVAYTSELRFHPRQRIAWLESQLHAARIVKHRKAEGSALGNLGLAYTDLGDVRKAIEFHERALVVESKISHWHGVAQTLGNLGLAHAALGDLRKAIGYYEENVAVAREIGDLRSVVAALANLGNALADLGEARKAIEFHEQALAIIRHIGDQRDEARIVGNLATVHADLGNARKAVEFFEQALPVFRAIGDQRGEGSSLWNSALALDSLGERSEAVARAAAALAIFEAIEGPEAAKVRAKLAEWRGEP